MDSELDLAQQDIVRVQQWNADSSTIDIHVLNRVLGQPLVTCPADITPELMAKAEALCWERKENLVEQAELDQVLRTQWSEHQAALAGEPLNIDKAKARWEAFLANNQRQMQFLKEQYAQLLLGTFPMQVCHIPTVWIVEDPDNCAGGCANQI